MDAAGRLRRRRRAARPVREPREDRASVILARIRRIPPGKVQSYGGIDPEAPRLVGLVLARTDEELPWHRVVRADGSLAKGSRQRELLVAEGVAMRGDRVDMRRSRARVSTRAAF